MSEMVLRELQNGMVLLEDAYTKSGTQLVLPKGTVLDEQRIARLAFYGVSSVNVATREQAALVGLLAEPGEGPKPIVTGAPRPGTQVPPSPVIKADEPAAQRAVPARPAPGGSARPQGQPATPARPAAPAPVPARPAPAATPVSPDASYSERVRSSAEFKKFRMDFEDTFLSYQRQVNDMLSGGREMDTNVLVEPVYDLIHSCYGPSNVFDMLHALRAYDDATYVHSVNVALIAHTIGEWMHLEEDDKELLTKAGLLLDVGKMMIPQEILTKKGKLTDDERTKLRMHPALGYRAVEKKNIDPHIKNTILMHHERCDGSGYPRHLTYNQIDPVARIVSIADVYDAMTSERVYRQALSPFYAFEQIEEDGLQKYDTQAVMTFLDNLSGVYIGNRVKLSDGSVGEIVYINKMRYSRPTVRVGSRFLDLFEKRDLQIEALL